MVNVESCLVLDVGDDADPEIAALALWHAGARAVAIEDDAGRPRLVAGFAADEEVRRAARHLAPSWAVPVVEVDDGWRDAWRAYASVTRVGRLVVRPVWVPFEPGDADVVVDVEPGDAFGDGSHATTVMALEEIVERVRAGTTVLDVGCGSGVLALAAARLGAGRVVAVDVDPGAVAVTADNARRNDVVVDVVVGSADRAAGTFDVVVANLGGSVVVRDLAAALAAKVAPNGVLVLGGLRDDRDVARWFSGLRPSGRRVQDGWVTVVLAAP